MGNTIVTLWVVTATLQPLQHPKIYYRVFLHFSFSLFSYMSIPPFSYASFPFLPLTYTLEVHHLSAVKEKLY